MDNSTEDGDENKSGDSAETNATTDAADATAAATAAAAGIASASVAEPDPKTSSVTELPLQMLYDVPLQVAVELGRRRMPLLEIAKFGPGSVVELGKPSGEALDIYVNDRLIARGEAVLVGERYGVRVTEVLASKDGIATEAGLGGAGCS